MRESFLRLLDQSWSWDIDCWVKQQDHVWDGILLADGKPRYPIIAGIPRLLNGGWLENCFTQHPEFVYTWRHKLDDLIGQIAAYKLDPETEQIKHATVMSFGEEWKRFNKLLDSYKQNHRDYFQPYGPEFFQGKTGLDVGCGMGRHVYWAAQYGAEMIAVDLSQAIEVAFRNLCDCPSVHVAQADIYHLPFPSASFDFVESIGVVHHLPDPEGALHLLANLVRPGGCLFVYLYTKSGRQPTSYFGKAKLALKENVYRKIGHSLPRALLFYYSLAYAVVGRLLFNIPYKVLSRLPGLRSRLENMPLRYYADYPLYVLHTDIYDWVATPLSRHYDLQELQQMFGCLPFAHVEYRRNPEWRVFAWK